MEFFVLALLAVVLLPLLFAVLRARKSKSFKKLVFTNIALFAIMAVCVIAFTPMIAAADKADSAEATAIEETAQGDGLRNGLGYLGAALATGMYCIGAGIAVSGAASSAIGATSENPKMFTKSMIFVALAEGVALYGLLISFQIISNLS